jgi:NAD+ diphosphatase
MTMSRTFSGNPLDRAHSQRRDEAWLERAVKDSASRFLAFSQLKVLVDNRAGPRLAWLGTGEVGRLRMDQPPVLLGLLDRIAHFAVDIPGDPEVAEVLGSREGLGFAETRAAAMCLDRAETGILAQARAQVEWHTSQRYCGKCGGPTEPARGGEVRICLGCRVEHFPRTNPVVMALISDGDRCLLGRSAGWIGDPGLYSALAGFVDQGESIEEAVRREVREEAGIAVGEVRYHSSQPWPFPSSLMIGCHGRALTSAITIDPGEMADVSWFEREEVRFALLQTHPVLRVPGPLSIAHDLIGAWCDGRVDL